MSKLTEENMEEALKEVRTALLSADVHFKVARDFVERVKAACIGQAVLQSVTPGQQIIKIIHDELVTLLGEGSTELSGKRPLRILLVGLHGSGKTTSTGKLAHHLRKKGYKPALIACDVYRPAAIDQLETIANKEDFLFFADRNTQDVPNIGKQGLRFAQDAAADAILFDTAGRLQIDNDLIEEIKKLHQTINPDEIFLVADSALGQEAVNVAKHFHDAVELTGIILTKLDGDARGGAALSMKSITGVPIKFMGVGEKVDDFERFHPDRMAQRILGMGDVVSLVEQAQEKLDHEETERLAQKLRKADFTLEDFLAQLQQMKKLGPLNSIMEKLPGMGDVSIGDKETKQLAQTEAIIQSMTPKERNSPQILNGSRRMRIAKGSGVQVKDVNALLKQFTQMRKMMKSMKGAKGKKMMQKMANMGGGKMPNFPGMGF
ncbi:MAG TPA: signal recognition particle protein [Opitutae bacterium]|nr:signal recognition particle protein [Opitutae bacterium]